MKVHDSTSELVYYVYIVASIIGGLCFIGTIIGTFIIKSPDMAVFSCGAAFITVAFLFCMLLYQIGSSEKKEVFLPFLEFTEFSIEGIIGLILFSMLFSGISSVSMWEILVEKEAHFVAIIPAGLGVSLMACFLGIIKRRTSPRGRILKKQLLVKWAKLRQRYKIAA